LRREKSKYTLNPQYILRNDIKRVLLFYKNADPSVKEGISDFIGFLHPVLAILLSLCDGYRTILNVADEFESVSGIPKARIIKLLLSLVENQDIVKIDFNGHYFLFPLNTLVPYKNTHPHHKYNPFEYLIPNSQLDFEQQRLYIPLDSMLMLNNVCVTQCIYCYVEKSKTYKCQIPYKRIVELIKEASEIGMRSFNPTGGEVFTYRYWKELLRELVQNHFDPYVTTKYPLNERRIKELKDTGIKRINLSIDTIDRTQMKQLLRVEDSYYDLFLKSLKYLNNNNFDICIHSQVNSINQDNMEKLFKYLLSFENINCIKVRATAFSRFFKGGANTYSKLRPDKKKLESLKKVILQLKETHGDKVDFYFHDYQQKKKYINPSKTKKQDFFENRAQCSGNFHGFYILPDGKVTICEELYWHPQFIIGDILEQSIQEVWNSEKALSLYRISKEQIRSQSACKSCSDFDSCHLRGGICWKQVIYAYGSKNWDYPDPRCPHAPLPGNEFWIE